MLLFYGSIPHIFSLTLAFFVVFLLYLSIRRRNHEQKRAVVFAIAAVNLFQHLFKSFVWPHLYGNGFGHVNTAYNVCAFLILLSPVALILPFSALKDFVIVVGSAAGALPLLVPTWFVGRSILEWEFVRCWVCHVLLLASSLLSSLLHTPSKRSAPFCGVFFLGMLGFVLLDLVLCVEIGWIGTRDDVYGSLLAHNPFMAVAPFEWVPDAVVFKWHGRAIPILWYALPVYLVVSGGVWIVGAAVGKRKKTKNSRFTSFPSSDLLQFYG